MSGNASVQLVQQGGRLIADYGSYALIDVDGAKLSALPKDSYQLRDEYRSVLLNAGTIDALDPAAQRMREAALPASGRQLHLVQFAGTVKNDWYAQLQGTGVQVVAYVPHNAYLVYGDATSLSRLISYAKAAPEVQWDAPYLNDYKINPHVYTVAQPDGWQVQLVEDAQGNADTLARVAAMEQGQLIDQRALGYVDLVVHADRDSVLALAKQPDVVSIYPWVSPRKLDERADMIAAGQLVADGSVPTGAGYLAWLASKGFTQAQFDATNVGVDVSDSGLDNGTTSPNNFGLYSGGDITGSSRVTYARLVGTPHAGSTIEGCDGHGNLNSHIIMAFNNLTGTPHTDAAGYHYNLGIAPFAHVGSSVVFDPSSFTSPDYEDLQSMAYRDGMRVSSNSWGAAVGGAYTADSQRYDALVRDAQPTASAVPAPGNQEMIIVFAAGNSGSGANTVGSPATGKNVITAGAANNVHPFGAADQCGIGDTDADNANDIVFFSSRGPCDDGRIKPDLSAAGTHVSGGVAQSPAQHANPPGNPNGEANSCFTASQVCAGPGTSNFWPLNQQWTTASSGTSHSTPLIAGAALMARQWLINNNGATPSATLVKAWLMNSARYMTGSGANDNLYSNNQGMGHLNLGFAVDGTPRFIRDEDPADLFTATGQTRTFNIFAADPAKPFRVTLAWTDAPGSTTGNSFNNNLDLSVSIGGNTYLGNVFTKGASVTGGVADIRNNVESVFLPPGTTGPVTVTVAATNINSDGVPGNASALDQDFALVAYNVCGTRGTAPTGVTATVPGRNQIQIDWTAAGGTNTDYHIYRSTTAGGPYTQVGSVPATASTFTDSTVSGGTTYFYVVRGVDCAESTDSNEASATATGDCTLLPTFAGAASATNSGSATCGISLGWAAATPACSGTLTYNVYRSKSSGFTPGTATRIATGVSGLSFADNANLQNGVPYYYVVRAVETGAATVEETNTVQRSAAPTGVTTPAFAYFDDQDANRPPNAAAYWIPSATTIQTTTACRFQSSNKAWRFGQASTACGGTYPISREDRLVFGGNGSTAGVNGFALPANTAGSTTRATLSFSHAWGFEANFDGAFLEYSTAGAAGPWTPVPGAVTAGSPYIVSGTYNGHATSNRPTWTGNAGFPANGAFSTTTVNVDALAGQTVWFAWHYVSDGSITFEGHYLDDVTFNANSITSCTPGAVPPGPAATYAVALPASSQAGVAQTATITAMDSYDQVATGYAGTANLTTSDPRATIPATTDFVAGVSSPSITFGSVGLQTVTAADSADSSIRGTGGTMVTPGAPAQLRFSVQPSNAVAGVSIAPAIKVQVLDIYGNLVPTATDSITMAIGANPGGGTLLGTVTKAAVGGVATFSDLKIQKAALGYTLIASSGALTSAESATFDIRADVPVDVRWGQDPTNALAGAPFNPAARVEIVDQYGNVNGSQVWTVFVSILNNAGGGTLLGTTFQDTTGGAATFPDIAVSKVGTGYTLQANVFGFGRKASAAFDISANVPHHITVTQQPTDTQAHQPISTVTAEVRDAYENLETGSSAAITASLAGGTPGAALSGTTTVSASGGVASFSDLSVDKAGAAYSLVLGSTGLSSAVTTSFDVAPGPAPVAVEFVQQPSNSTAGAAIAPAITVRVVDANGNTVTDAAEAVTLSIGTNAGGGTLSGGLASTPVNGVATFSTASVDKAGTGYTLVASSGALTSATSAAFNVAAAAATHLVFGAQPSNSIAGRTISPAVTVEARDAYGNLDTGFTGAVSVALNGGNSNATLGGTTTQSAAAGVATFSDLSVNKSGRNYSLAASAGGVSGASSSTFNVSNGPPSKLVISGLAFSATAFVPVPFTVTAYDDQDNVAVDYAGTASVASDDVQATLPANATFASGVASNVRITFKTTGVHSVTVTDTAASSLTASGSVVVTNFPQPTVSITAPGNGSEVTGSVSITAEGAVATGTTLTNLEIFVDGTSVQKSTTSPATATWDVTKLKSGTTHLIHAVVSDAAGNVVQSTPLTVIIGQQGCGCSSGAGGMDMALLAAVGAALRAFALRRRRAAR